MREEMQLLAIENCMCTANRGNILDYGKMG